MNTTEIISPEGRNWFIKFLKIKSTNLIRERKKLLIKRCYSFLDFHNMSICNYWPPAISIILVSSPFLCFCLYSMMVKIETLKFPMSSNDAGVTFSSMSFDLVLFFSIEFPYMLFGLAVAQSRTKKLKGKRGRESNEKNNVGSQSTMSHEGKMRKKIRKRTSAS